MTAIHHDSNTDREVLTTTEARAGSGGQQVRYVMVASTLGAAIAMSIVLIYLWNTWS